MHPGFFAQDENEVEDFDNLMMPHQDDITILDLHGKSVDQAREYVELHLMKAYHAGRGHVRIITGRGNHVNARGERGTLYRECKEWLALKKFSEITKQLIVGDGYYDLVLSLVVSPEFSEMKAKVFDDLDKEALFKAAEENNCEAQNTLVYLYEKGLGGFDSDDKEAFKWCLKAAKSGSMVAQLQVAVFYFVGKGVRQSDSEAIKWLKEASNQKSALAALNLASIYGSGWGVESDAGQAVVYLAVAAKRGNAVAMRRLASCYLQGSGVALDCSKAVSWYKKAAEKHDAYSQYNLAIMYEKGEVVDRQDHQLAFQYYLASAKGGDLDGICSLGRCYLHGIGIPTDLPLAFKWISKAAEANHADALGILSEYYHKLGDLEKAHVCELASANAGSVQSQAFLVMRSRVDPDVQLDKEMLEKLVHQPMEELVKLDNSPLLFVVAYLIVSNPVKRQKKKALTVLQFLISERDCGQACLWLGITYLFQNKIVGQNYKFAFSYFGMGAALGNPDCFLFLADCYEKGLGVEKSEEKQQEHLRTAAEKGSSWALCTLAMQVLTSFNRGFNKDELQDVLDLLERAIHIASISMINDVRCPYNVSFLNQGKIFEETSFFLARLLFDFSKQTGDGALLQKSLKVLEPIVGLEHEKVTLLRNEIDEHLASKAKELKEREETIFLSQSLERLSFLSSNKKKEELPHSASPPLVEANANEIEDNELKGWCLIA